MASKDEAAAASSTAALFGADTDSSDESVGATTKAAETNTNASADGGTLKKTIQENEAMNTNDDDGSDDENEAEAEAAADSNKSTKTKSIDNSALFDDDSSDDDNEFQDDGNIIGTANTKNSSTKEAPVVKTMNQTLGLDSDSDDNDDKMDTEMTEEERSPPVYVPPRKMELLSLNSSNNKTTTNQIQYHTVKLPNLVGINITPYNSKTHDAKSEEEFFRGHVHNMIRWRYKLDEDTGELLRANDIHVDDNNNNEELVRESNTRLVKWSDGSYTLHVGQEVLEVDNLDSSVPMEGGARVGGGGGGGGVLPGFSGINGYLYASQKARIRPPTKKELEGPPKKEGEGDNNGREETTKAGDDDGETNNGEQEEEEEVPPPTQPGGTVLECLGPIQSRFAPRPSSLASNAHRNLTLAVRQRNVKRARIAEIVTDFDPESEKAKRIKNKDDMAKESNRRSSSGGGRRSGGGGGGGGGRRRGMNASYLEDDDDYDGVNLTRLKRQTMRRDEYSDDEEELDYGQDSASSEEDEWSKKKTQKRGAAAARAARNNESEDESSEDGEVVL